ncbi:MAG: hypothetical protein V1871_01105, partial [Planctomycetota bacterium]
QETSSLLYHVRDCRLFLTIPSEASPAGEPRPNGGDLPMAQGSKKKTASEEQYPMRDEIYLKK